MEGQGSCVRVDLKNSKLVAVYLAAAFFVANVPTESTTPGFSEAIILFAWTAIWAPFLLVGAVIPDRRILSVVLVLGIYILSLNMLSVNLRPVIMAANMFSAAMVISVFANSRMTNQLLRAIDVTIITWSVMLILQVLILSASGRAFDIHATLFPFSEARLGPVGTAGLYRLSGPHLEPGTYSVWMYGIVLFRILLGGRVVTKTILFGMATVPVTQSIWGIGATVIFIASSMFLVFSVKGLVKTVTAWSLMLGILYFTFSNKLAAVSDYVSRRSDLADASGSAKVAAYDELGQNYLDYAAVGRSFTFDYCEGCLSPQDAGVAPNMLVYLGGAVTAAVIVVLLVGFYKRFGNRSFVLVIPLFTAKFFIWDTLLWCLIFASMHYVFRRNDTLT